MLCGTNWDQTFIWYNSHSLYLQSKANLFVCWKLFHCTEIFFSGRLQMFEITKVKTCSITAAMHHPAVKKQAKTPRFTGSCTASKQVRPQNPNITDSLLLDWVPRNLLAVQPSTDVSVSDNHSPPADSVELVLFFILYSISLFYSWIKTLY